MATILSFPSINLHCRGYHSVMKHSELLQLLAQDLYAAFSACFPASDYTVDSIPFYGKRT